MDALLQSSADVTLVATGVAAVVEVTEGMNSVSDLLVKDFCKCVQRVWKILTLSRDGTACFGDVFMW